MKIAFMGTDAISKEEVVHQISTFYGTTTKIWEKDFVQEWQYQIGLKRGKAAQRHIDWWHVRNHFFRKDFVAASSIYDAWATARSHIDPWYHHTLFSWAAKRIWYDYLFYIQPTVADTEKIKGSVEKELGLIVTFHHIPFHILTGSLQDKVDQIKVITERV